LARRFTGDNLLNKLKQNNATISIPRICKFNTVTQNEDVSCTCYHENENDIHSTVNVPFKFA
jgi:hypothetical protein